MKITNVCFSIWVDSKEKTHKNFNNCEEAELLLHKITALIKENGYLVKGEHCGKNPSLAIFKE